MPLVEPPTYATFTINNVVGAYIGTYAEDNTQDWIDGESQVIDPTWLFVDPSGHFHAFDTKSSDTPTLRKRTVHIPCDSTCPDGCDGYPATRFSCLLCDVEIIPRYKPVVERIVTNVHYGWKATVQGPIIKPGTKVSALIQNTGGAPRFGVATVGAVTMESGRESTMELIGLSRLGYRPA